MNNSIRTAAKTMAAVIAAGAMAVAPVAGTINFGAMTAMAAVSQNTVSIGGLKAGDTVSLYQIVHATYSTTTADDSKWTGWAVSDKVTDGCVSIKSDGTELKVNVGTLVTDIKAESSTWTTSNTPTALNASANGTFTSKKLDPGVYVALIAPGTATNNDMRIYNPVFLSVSYEKDTNGNMTATAGTISDITAESATLDQSKIENTTTGITNKAYAKSSVTKLEKWIVNKDSDGVTAENPGKVKAEDLQKGDISDFEIDSTIPDYSGFTNLGDSLTFRIDDNQDAQFGYPRNLKISVNDVDVTRNTGVIVKYGHFTEDGTGKYSGLDGFSETASTENAKEDFSISFTKDFILQHPAQPVVIQYSAELYNPTTYSGTDDNDNNVRLTYSNDNQSSESHNTKDDKTTDYSFKINVKKVDATDTAKTLEGAKFTLTRQTKNENGNLVDYEPTDGDHVKFADKESAETGENGLVSFTGLDEGYYKIVETQAPHDGTTQYSVTSDPFYIHVTPSSYTNQATNTVLTGYRIAECDVTGTDLESGTALSRASEDTTSEYTLTVKDTPFHGLPSTGARSALILTIAGIAVMITVMAASRRKKIAD